MKEVKMSHQTAEQPANWNTEIEGAEVRVDKEERWL